MRGTIMAFQEYNVHAVNYLFQAHVTEFTNE
jgi:hypothetical protein